MISYDPLWETMESKQISKYQLINHYGISSNTIRRLQHGEPMSTTTLNKLCLILDCTIDDVMMFAPTEEELAHLASEKQRLAESKGIRFTF